MSYPFVRKPLDPQRRAMVRAYRQGAQGVFFDPGYGKSKVAIDFVGSLLYHGKIKRALFIAPKTAVFSTWQEQLSIDAPHLKYSILHPDKKTNWDVPILLTNYEYFIPRRKWRRSKRTGLKLNRTFLDWSSCDKLMEWKPDVIVIDEGHKIKNPTSRSAKACHYLSAVSQYRLDLTGTPKGNKKVLDLWSQIEFLVPGLLGTHKEFEEKYVIWGGPGGFKPIKFKNLKELARILAPYVIRQKADDLPPQKFINVKVDIGDKARKVYKKMEKELITSLPSGETITAAIALAKFTKLSQIAGGFIRTNDGIDIEVHRAKAEAMSEILSNLKSIDEKRVVIFARFHWELDIINHVLDKSGWDKYEISGRVKDPEMRNQSREEFNRYGGAMVCQTATGSTSLNLQAARYAIIYSPTYSVIDWDQLLKRIHRRGQEFECIYYILKAVGTIDTKIYKSLEENRSVEKEFMKLLDEIRREAA